MCKVKTKEGSGEAASKGGKGLNPFAIDDIYTCNTSVICGTVEGNCHVQPETELQVIRQELARKAGGGGGAAV